MKKKKCPDDGACRHYCISACWRVGHCAPLSSYGKDWTKEDKREYIKFALKEESSNNSLPSELLKGALELIRELEKEVEQLDELSDHLASEGVDSEHTCPSCRTRFRYQGGEIETLGKE